MDGVNNGNQKLQRSEGDSGRGLCPGVVLQRARSPADLPPPKLTRAELPSDDEVEVVTEWLAPSVLEVRGKVLESPPTLSPPTSPPLHVPVIQRPSDSSQVQIHFHSRQSLMNVNELISESLSCGAFRVRRCRWELQRLRLLQVQVKFSVTRLHVCPTDTDLIGRCCLSGDQAMVARSHGVNGNNTEAKEEERQSLKRAAPVEDVYLLDASKEGNVSRFINVSDDDREEETRPLLPVVVMM